MQRLLILSGFTLIELLITLAIMSILVGIALPSYQHNILTTHRHQAKMKLTAISLLQTDHFSRQQQYAELQDLAVDLSSSKYQYSIHLAENNQYTVSATAIDNQRDDSECRELSLDNNLTRSPTHCW
ncbi:type IV pilin protein [Moritella sp. Urea-trap-13]|uniref:type IV pilin protein n=1 Tax=Moritella sp. Urea-trap-13 TaxID=2058327 RepID=UPI000C32C9E7|nr:type IV pilin protein [Moritella sp. Urea-trap-13]PKH07180.1 prepilin-type cleavage/methylation domain-containing protein [Moritella sp. Urea-trap-13]